MSEGIEKLNEERKLFNDNMQDLMDKLFDVEKNLEKANSREDRILEQKAKLINEVKDKDNEIQDLKKRVYETDDKMKRVMEDLNNFIEKLQREKTDLKEQNKQLKGELEDKEGDIADLEKELISQTGGRSKLRRMDTTMEIDINLKKEAGKLDKERANQLEKLVANLENELSKLRRNEELGRQREGDLKDEIEQMERDLKQEQRKNDNLLNDIEDLEEDLRLQVDLREEQEKVKNAGMNVSMMQGRKEMVGLSEKVKKLTEENRKLMDDLERIRGEREVWKERGAQVEDELVLRNKEIDILKRAKRKDVEDLDKIKHLLESKKRDLEQRRRNEEMLRLEGMKLSDEKLKAEGEKMLAQKERDHARKLAEDDTLYLKEDLDKKNKQIAALKAKLKDSQNENEDLEFKVYNLEKKVSLGNDVKDKLETDIEIKDAKIADLQSQIEYLKNQIVQIESQEGMNRMDME